MATVLLAAPLPPGACPPVGFVGPDDERLQAWLQAKGQADAYNKNTNLTTEYLEYTFANWYLNYMARGTNPDDPPPQPPRSYVVIVADDGVNIDIQQLGGPVCAVPIYTKCKPPANPANNIIVSSTPPDWAALFAKTSTDVLHQVLAPDGGRWMRVG